MDKAEDGEAIAPGPGDLVTVPDVKGVVESDEGDMLSVRISQIGGYECGKEEEGEEKESMEELDGDKLRSMAAEGMEE